MKHTLLSLFTVGTIAVGLCSCESMRPNDNLQKVVSGDIFSSKPVDARQEKVLDEAAWRENQEIPAHYSADPETARDNAGGRLAFEMPVR